MSAAAAAIGLPFGLLRFWLSRGLFNGAGAQPNRNDGGAGLATDWRRLWIALAEAEKDPSKRADLWVRAGKILEDRGDKDRAIEKYKKALDADKKSSSAISALS